MINSRYLYPEMFKLPVHVSDEIGGGVLHCISACYSFQADYLGLPAKGSLVFFYRLYENVPSLNYRWYRWRNVYE